jgi:hypothetical protein
LTTVSAHKKIYFFFVGWRGKSISNSISTRFNMFCLEDWRIFQYEMDANLFTSFDVNWDAIPDEMWLEMHSNEEWEEIIETSYSTPNPNLISMEK